MFSRKILLLLIIFLALRLYFIYTFPPYTDESLYIRWGQLMIDNPALRWASFDYVNRQPLAFWLFGIGAILFHNPLIGARIMMLIWNIPLFFLLLAITKKLFDEKTALLSLIILTFAPLHILLGSLAIMDGFLLPISMGLIYIFVVDWKRNRYIYMAAISILLGVSLWIKTTSVFLYILAGIGVVWKDRATPFRISRLIEYLLAILVLPLCIISFMWLGGKTNNIFKEPGNFTFSLQELLHFPFQAWLINALHAFLGVGIYFNPLFVIPFSATRKYMYKRINLLLLLWIIAPCMAYVIFGKNFQIRYFSYSLIACIPFLAFSLSHTFERYRNTATKILTITLIFLYGLFFTTKPLLFFSLFPLGSLERDYALSWPSGYGIPELISWINTQEPKKGILPILVADSPGNPSDFILATYYFNPHIRTIIVPISTEVEIERLREFAEKQPLYLATRSTLIAPNLSSYFKPIKLFNKPLSNETIGIYQIVFTNK